MWNLSFRLPQFYFTIVFIFSGADIKMEVRLGERAFRVDGAAGTWTVGQLKNALSVGGRALCVNASTVTKSPYFTFMLRRA